MTLEEHIKYWITSAEHDFKIAKHLFESRRYDWSLFVGHLVLEKMLKAIWVRDNNNKFPPKRHNLLLLASETKLNLSEEQKLQFLNINDFNIEARYPDYKMEFYKKCRSRRFSSENYGIIENLFRWLKKQI